MIVVEIGCGYSAGPFYDGADQHFIVDNDPEALQSAAKKSPDLTPLPDADALQLGLPDSSVDVVLARNVFGDLDLGLDPMSKANLSYVINYAASAREMISIFNTHTAARDAQKNAILKEASRVLLQGGQLIAVEQYSPALAVKFFETAGQSTEHGLHIIESEKPELILPADYLAAHHEPGIRVWSGQR